MRRALLVFFAASGFSALVYELVWLRLALGAFGVNAPAVSIFLSSFMAGLGLGSWSAGRLAGRLRGPAARLRAYGLLELALAGGALLVPLELRGAQDLLAGQAWASGTYYALAGTLVAAVLLPWCALSGATLPLALAALEDGRGSPFSSLYAANVLGAALGCAAAAFALVEWLGLSGALRAAAAAGALAGASAVALSFIKSPAGARRGATMRSGRASIGRAPRGTLALLFLTGFCAMGLEVVWTRLYVPFAGNTVYAFANILAFYLLATFAGAAAYRASKKKPAVSVLLAAAALGGLLSLAAADRAWPSRGLSSFLAQLALGVLPFSAALGWLTPALVDERSGGAPREAGLAYAVNVAGCIAGPLAAGFLLLPRLGAPASLLVLCLPLLAAAFLSARRARAPELALAAGCAALALFGLSRPAPERLVLRDSEAEVEAWGAGMDRRLAVNGASMTMLDPVTKMMAHLPLALLPRKPARALDLCFGMGTTFRSLLSWDVEVTAVDLVPSVPRLFGFFHDDGPALLAAAGPRARIVVDDGRRFLERDGGLYDVVTIDPPPPVNGAYSAMLYSADFYAVARRRLAPGGILAQWIPGDLDPAVTLSMLKSLASTFACVRVFKGAAGWGYHALGSDAPIVVPAGRALALKLPPAAARDLVEWGRWRSPREALARVLGSEVPFERIAGRFREVPALTDDRPFNEYFYLRYNHPKVARALGL